MEYRRSSPSQRDETSVQIESRLVDSDHGKSASPHAIRTDGGSCNCNYFLCMMCKWQQKEVRKDP